MSTNPLFDGIRNHIPTLGIANLLSYAIACYANKYHLRVAKMGLKLDLT
jgi:hypothetical protein